MADPILPPTPLTVVDAIVVANALAYGFDKHLNDGYWNDLYGKDPDYAWKRMLGWLAGGADIARFGLYAIPPSPWHGTIVDPPVVVPPVDVPPAGPSPEMGMLSLVLTKLDDLEGLIRALKPPVYEGTVQVPYLGSGKITLTPKP